jgi:hypothetical protein
MIPNEKKEPAPQRDFVARSWGTLKLPSGMLKELLEDEDSFLGSQEPSEERPGPATSPSVSLS